MRVFLCAFGDFLLAIPIHSVSSLALYTEAAALPAALPAEIPDMQQPMIYNTENRNTYVSLPLLFNLPLKNLRHSLVLKDSCADVVEDEDIVSDVIEGKTILLTTEVECEAEIPGEDIFPVPKALMSTRFSRLFSGIRFAQGIPVLFLNPAHLVQNIQTGPMAPEDR
jgi:hypothetical protein